MLKLKNFLVLNINMNINITDGIIKKYAIALIVMLIVISPAIGYFLYTSWWGTYDDSLQDVTVDIYSKGILDTARALSILTMITFIMMIIFVLLVGTYLNN
jgi:hypothetical protein